MEQESLVKRNPRGKFVGSRQRKMIINAYKSKLEKNPSMTIKNIRSTLSKELGIGETTISNTISQYRQHKTVSSPNKTKKFKNIETKVNDFDKSAIRKIIHKFWFDYELPTLDKILKVINNDSTLPSFSRTSLYRLLKSMEFEYSKRGHNSILLEKSEIVLWRRKYLKDIKKYREEGRPIYYLDETLVDSGDVSERVWCNKTVQPLTDVHTQDLSPGPVNPSGKENRLIVIHIGSEDGFVPGGLLCVESQNNYKDYHDEINGGFYCDWLKGVLSKLKDNAIIIMNNAPYNSVKLEKCPTINWNKADIMEWLKSKGEVIDQSMIIPELLENVNRLKPMYSKYIVDEMVRQHNKVVLRLPPYHCGLNPIPLAWSVVKSHIRSNNKTFKLSDVKKLLIEGTEKVDLGMWKNFISHTMEEEEKFWNVDNVLDELMEETKTVIKTYCNSDEDEDSSSS